MTMRARAITRAIKNPVRSTPTPSPSLISEQTIFPITFTCNALIASTNYSLFFFPSLPLLKYLPYYYYYMVRVKPTLEISCEKKQRFPFGRLEGKINTGL
ncbi:hypothetical protein P3X46_015180 [Hevea brasiliensis]|uniref:Uncharacterized protein n=1 Tax=Hevea brasiliensis TaxID=3981 RepID=A0ABQ9LZ53_HEVBR|nr:hypothetical protein P3X46_015180 [Hevea brasiliensis]